MRIVTTPLLLRQKKSKLVIDRKMLHFFAVCILITVCTFPTFAQKFTGSLDLQLSVPQGEYKNNNNDVGLGARFNFLWRPKKTLPVKIGLEAGYQSYGSRSQNFEAFVYGFYEQYRVTASNNIASVTFMTRLQSAKFHKVKPFVDAIFGWNVFFSSVNVERLNNSSYYDDNNSYGNSSKARWAFTYGTAAGIDIPLSKNDDIGLEIKCAYMFGANTRYLTNPQIDATGTAYFTEKESKTDMLVPQIGVRLNIE